MSKFLTWLQLYALSNHFIPQTHHLLLVYCHFNHFCASCFNHSVLLNVSVTVDTLDVRPVCSLFFPFLYTSVICFLYFNSPHFLAFYMRVVCVFTWAPFIFYEFPLPCWIFIPLLPGHFLSFCACYLLNVFLLLFYLIYFEPFP